MRAAGDPSRWRCILFPRSICILAEVGPQEPIALFWNPNKTPRKSPNLKRCSRRRAPHLGILTQHPTSVLFCGDSARRMQGPCRRIQVFARAPAVVFRTGFRVAGLRDRIPQRPLRRPYRKQGRKIRPPQKGGFPRMGNRHQVICARFLDAAFVLDAVIHDAVVSFPLTLFRNHLPAMEGSIWRRPHPFER